MHLLILAFAMMVSHSPAFAANPPFVHSVPLPVDRSDADILDLAAHVVPSPRQLAYQQQEFIAFIHFGPNTFTGVEWGSGKEDPTRFAPPAVDTDQWCEILQAAGMKKVILTVKHHDGYCLWQTKYNDAFSVAQSPWKNGRGDVLRQLVDSCRKYGLKVGVYLSPADLFQMRSENGYYGNGSAFVDSVIPTHPEHFTTDPTRVREVPESQPVFRLKTDAYNRYFMNQLYELLTEYGPIHEVWFDGANPDRSYQQTYIKEEWFGMIRKLAPEAVIFGGPDVRWCGNEHGGTRESEWSVLPVSSLAESGVDRPDENIGDDARLLADTYTVYGVEYRPTQLMYLISEVDTSIRNGWFWRNNHEQRVRSADDVFDIYERSVGGNAVFLLNVPPANDGRIPAEDEQVLLEVGRRIRATYGANLAQGLQSQAPGLDDEDLATYWQPGAETGSFTVNLPTPRTLNRVVLQEAVSQVGQRVSAHALDAWIAGEWQEVARATTIGYKRILRFPEVTSDRFRVRILSSRSQPTIATFAAHRYLEPPPPVQIARNAAGQVVLSSTTSTARIHYTLDGSEPSATSPQYTTPVDFPLGGTVRARSVVGEQLGTIASVRLGLAPNGWKVSASNQQPGWEAAKAVDGNPATFWHTAWDPGFPSHPHTLTIDMQAPTVIAGFRYLPRQDKRVPDSMVSAWRIEGSLDGAAWKTVAEGTFGNILNDPSRRTALFDRPAHIRYFRFVSLAGAEGKPYAGAAEIDLLSPE